MSDSDKASLLIAAVSLAIAAATFAFVLIGELRFRHRFAPVFWWLHYDHAENDPDTDDPRFHHYTLMNLGSDTATHVAVDATSGFQTSGSRAAVVRSGDSYPKLRIDSKNFDNDWILVSWIDATDRRYIRFQWFPLNMYGPLQNEFDKQWRKGTNFRWWQRIRPRRTERVGPGAGVIATTVRTGKNYSEYFKNIARARSLLDVTQEQRTGTQLNYRRQ